MHSEDILVICRKEKKKVKGVCVQKKEKNCCNVIQGVIVCISNSTEEVESVFELICVAREFPFSVPRMSVAMSTLGYTTQKPSVLLPIFRINLGFSVR